MEYIIPFIVALVISFVGSCQPGPVNMAVIYHATHKHYRSALFIAIGGSWPEFVFSFVALRFFDMLAIHIHFINQFSLVLDWIFIVVGIGLVLMRPRTTISKQYTAQKGVLSGILLASFNPQLILFWLGIITSLSIQDFKIERLGEQISFSIGTVVGAFLLHLILLWGIKKNPENKWVNKLKDSYFTIIGLILFIIGITHFYINY